MTSPTPFGFGDDEVSCDLNPKGIQALLSPLLEQALSVDGYGLVAKLIVPGALKAVKAAAQAIRGNPLLLSDKLIQRHLGVNCPDLCRGPFSDDQLSLGVLATDPTILRPSVCGQTAAALEQHAEQYIETALADDAELQRLMSEHGIATTGDDRTGLLGCGCTAAIAAGVVYGITVAICYPYGGVHPVGAWSWKIAIWSLPASFLTWVAVGLYSSYQETRLERQIATRHETVRQEGELAFKAHVQTILDSQANTLGCLLDAIDLFNFAVLQMPKTNRNRDSEQARNVLAALRDEGSRLLRVEGAKIAIGPNADFATLPTITRDDEAAVQQFAERVGDVLRGRG